MDYLPAYEVEARIARISSDYCAVRSRTWRGPVERRWRSSGALQLAGRGVSDAAARAGLTAQAVECGALKLAGQVRSRVPNLLGRCRGD